MTPEGPIFKVFSSKRPQLDLDHPDHVMAIAHGDTKNGLASNRRTLFLFEPACETPKILRIFGADLTISTAQVNLEKTTAETVARWTITSGPLTRLQIDLAGPEKEPGQIGARQASLVFRGNRPYQALLSAVNHLPKTDRSPWDHAEQAYAQPDSVPEVECVSASLPITGPIRSSVSFNNRPDKYGDFCLRPSLGYGSRSFSISYPGGLGNDIAFAFFEERRAGVSVSSPKGHDNISADIEWTPWGTRFKLHQSLSPKGVFQEKPGERLTLYLPHSE